MAGHEASMPADHGRRFHDQHHPNQASPVKATRQHGENGPVSGCESGPLDLSLQDEDLMAQGQDLASRLSPLTKSSPTRAIRSRNRCDTTEDTAGQGSGRAPSDLLRRVLGTLRDRVPDWRFPFAVPASQQVFCDGMPSPRRGIRQSSAPARSGRRERACWCQASQHAGGPEDLRP